MLDEHLRSADFVELVESKRDESVRDQASRYELDLRAYVESLAEHAGEHAVTLAPPCSAEAAGRRRRPRAR